MAALHDASPVTEPVAHHLGGRHSALWLAIVAWIENTYHRRRRQDTLGRLTPVVFETLLNTAYAA